MLSAEDLAFITGTLGRDLSDVEIACFENLWSEHCSYRSTRSLLKTLPTEGKNVILGPGDDAAIVRFSDSLALSIGMESHNHPSYVDPYDGAATGVGGIVRDVISMGSRPIALMDPLYFGPLASEKTRYLLEHVVAGIGDYGNCIGVPVVRGETVFDPSYQGNPLVNVVCVGVVDPGRFLTARVKAPGNRLVLVGSSTGRDGLGGASFASRDLSEESEAEDRPSVQIGDPFTEKLLIDAMMEMAETGKVLACRDLGAAGLAGASSEMASTFGARIVADRVHLREKGMNAVDIMLAESQERMLLEVAPADVALMGGIAAKYDLGWSEIGEVIAEPRYIVEFEGRTVCDLPIDLIVGGTPPCTLPKAPRTIETAYAPPAGDLKSLAVAVLSHPDVASRVLRLDDAALVLSCGCNPRHIALAPYANAANAVYENAANLACVGAEPLCIVNCLNFASPLHPEVFWEMEQAVLGLGEMARRIDVPVVGGNVSLYNESDEYGTEIKPTPSIGMAGRGPVRRWTKAADGDVLALVGKTGEHLGGSVLDAATGCGGAAPPMADPALLPLIRERVAADRFSGVTDLSKGGLLVALAKLAPDAEVRLAGEPVTALFSETCGRFLVAVHNEAELVGLPYAVIGAAGGEGLRIAAGDEEFVLSPEEIEFSLSTITRLMRY
ncbi:MAG: phosphoribosylformylglycinamidine synthase subunit PurL [Methanofollis sp.]|nr:phosphoribosylformylglycinamidine synthase subunit PurL [Methanofollis sp.]